MPPGRIAFSTDSFVVSPLFFPGGDIGDLAVNGTVNDVAMSGATPLHLSLGLIIEAGLAIKTLETILDSIQQAAKEASITIVTGNTKVVEKGSAIRFSLTPVVSVSSLKTFLLAYIRSNLGIKSLYRERLATME